MTDQQRSLRRPLLGAALTAAALGLCGVSPKLLAAGKRRVSSPGRGNRTGPLSESSEDAAFIDEMVARNGFQRANWNRISARRCSRPRWRG
jgi:membrane-bound lytic murein transglycosylase B